MKQAISASIMLLVRPSGANAGSVSGFFPISPKSKSGTYLKKEIINRSSIVDELICFALGGALAAP